MNEGSKPSGEHASPLWSRAHLAKHLGDPRLRIIDVRPAEIFAQGHIPGARSFDIHGLNCDDTAEAPLHSFLRMWTGLVARRGVDHSHMVVICGDITGSTAARGFWFLELLGHQDVHVLDGGFKGWAAAGMLLTKDAAVPRGKTFLPALRRERLATRDDVIAAIDDDSRIILDTRSTKEWLGTDVRAARGGTIPGAVHQDWRQHLDKDGRMKSAEELRRQFEGLGITPDKEVIPFCQTGYRSAHAYLALRILGYEKIRNYLGSWNEWGNREELPVVTPD